MKRIFIKRFEGAIEGYVVNYLKRNYWRVKGFMEYEDLMQEARFIFLKLKKQYSYVDNAKWFMALYKTAFSNYFNGVSNRRTERFSREVKMDDVTIKAYETQHTDTNQGYITCLVKQAPEEVRAVLSLLVVAPRELLEEVTKAWRAQGKRNTESSKHLAKLLGYDPDTDLIKAVREYFSNN